MQPAYEYSDLSVFQQRFELAPHDANITALSLSSDGKCLACGDDEGSVSIISVFPKPHVTQFLKAKTNIRALLWRDHSSSQASEHAVVVGSDNGDVWMVRVNGDGKLIYAQSEFSIKARIDAMAMPKSGNQLAIGSSDGIWLVDRDPFESPWPKPRSVAIPLNGIIRGMHYLGEDRLIVTFAVNPHIIVYDTSPSHLPATVQSPPSHFEAWKIDVRLIRPPSQLRPMPTYIGSSALSPNGRYIAVTNLQDGIDWYDLNKRSYLRTSSGKFGWVNGTQRGVGLAFLDNETVMVGDGDGQLKVVSLKNARKPALEFRDEPSSLCQLVTIALKDGAQPVIATSCMNKLPNPLGTGEIQDWKILFAGEMRRDKAITSRRLVEWVLVAGITLLLTTAVLWTAMWYQVAVTGSGVVDSVIRALGNQTSPLRGPDDYAIHQCTCTFPVPTRTVTAECVTQPVTGNSSMTSSPPT